jgi:hypothetical protein
MKNTPPKFGIDTSALLVEVSASCWTARKLDRTTSDEVVSAKSAKAKDAARVNVHLLAGRGELDVITKHITAARTFVYDNTLPWSDSGLRLLPAKNYFTFSQRIKEFEEEFDTLVDAFIVVYPTLITAQAMALGDMFKRDNYPSPGEIANRFAFRVSYMPVPNAGDFRVDIGNEAMAELAELYERLSNERVERAVGDLRTRLVEHLDRMSDRLTTDVVEGEAKRRKFHDTLVSGAYDLCDLMQSLNVTADSTIENARVRLEKALAGRSAEDLRDNDAGREHVKQEVDAILNMFKIG